MPTDLGDGVVRYSRREWGATGDSGSPGPKRRGHVVEHTFAMPSPGPGASVDAEKAIMRSVERFHRRRPRGWRAIGYAEVTTDSGRVYEGRGPGRMLAHAHGLNDTAYGFGHIGHGNRAPRAPGAWRAGRALHRWYVAKGWLTSLRYRLTGHRDHSSKDCPGTLVGDDDLAQLRPDSTQPAGGTDAAPTEPEHQEDDVIEIWTGKDPEGDEGVWAVQRRVTDDGHCGLYVLLTPKEAKQYKALGRRDDMPHIIVSGGTATPAWFTAGGLKRVDRAA